MIAITYLSTASSAFSASALEALLTVSRERNSACHVTGMLLHVDSQFIQTLEGEAVHVHATMERIRTDSRHRDVDVTLVEEIDERRFPDWTMGYKALTANEVEPIDGFTDFLEKGSAAYTDTDRLGRAGVFHRIFRDTLRLEG